MTTTPPQGIAPDILGDKVNAMLEQNGKLSVDEWRKLVSYMLQDIRADGKETVQELRIMKGEIHTLKRKNLVMWAERFPKITWVVLATGAIMVVLHAVELLPTLEHVIAVIFKFL